MSFPAGSAQGTVSAGGKRSHASFWGPFGGQSMPGSKKGCTKVLTWTLVPLEKNVHFEKHFRVGSGQVRDPGIQNPKVACRGV